MLWLYSREQKYLVLCGVPVSERTIETIPFVRLRDMASYTLTFWFYFSNRARKLQPPASSDCTPTVFEGLIVMVKIKDYLKMCKTYQLDLEHSD
jgi:hypothetical protein